MMTQTELDRAMDAAEWAMADAAARGGLNAGGWGAMGWDLYWAFGNGPATGYCVPAEPDGDGLFIAGTDRSGDRDGDDYVPPRPGEWVRVDYVHPDAGPGAASMVFPNPESAMLAVAFARDVLETYRDAVKNGPNR